MAQATPVTLSGIASGLDIVGISAGDVVLVHSSLSAFGHVEGGADTVIDALLETVGATGTVVVPTFTWGPFHKAETAVLDIVNTPVKDEVGIIPETFRKRPQARRSVHICHSVAAIGPHTDGVMGEGIRSFGAGSTFHQLYQLDAWCLFLGASFGSCTELHAVEEYMQVPRPASSAHWAIPTPGRCWPIVKSWISTCWQRLRWQTACRPPCAF